ncbi:MAG: hypothetical protein QXE14_01565, partial [Candidatus Bathyarchaeia archaeon]
MIMMGGGFSLSSPFKGLFKKKVAPPPEVAVFSKVPENAEIIESYMIHNPFARVVIASLPDLGG